MILNNMSNIKTKTKFEEIQAYNNPFYDNHLFTKEDIKRITFSKWAYPVLWFIPMKVQITEDGVAYYKTYKGQYFFYGFKLK